jgi:hypothetical protein
MATKFKPDPQVALDRATKDYLFISRHKEKHTNYAQAEEMAWTKLMEAVEAAKKAGVLDEPLSEQTGTTTVGG